MRLKAVYLFYQLLFSEILTVGVAEVLQRRQTAHFWMYTMNRLLKTHSIAMAKTNPLEILMKEAWTEKVSRDF